LNVVQPALSKQISRLENELGVRLLNRTKRSVELTEAGQVFLEDARQVLDQSERAVLKARLMAKGEIGSLAVGTVGSATYGVFTEVWGLYRKRFPDVTLAPYEMPTAEQVEALRDGKIELGFLRLPADYVDEDLEVRAFLRESLMSALPTTHPLSSVRHVPLEVLEDESFVMPSRELEPHYYEQQVGACKTAGFIPKVVQEARSMQVGLTLTAAGTGVCLVPVSVRKLKTAGVLYKELMEPVPEVELSIAWRRDILPPVARSFLEVAEEVARKKILP
jgi:DNA-binding transcriptional LysR family regulator